MTPDTPSALDAAEARLRKLEARISVAPFVEIPTATGDFMRALRNDALAVIDGLRAQLAEARAAERRAEVDVEEMRHEVTRLRADLSVSKDYAAGFEDGQDKIVESENVALAALRTQVAALLAEREELRAWGQPEDNEDSLWALTVNEAARDALAACRAVMLAAADDLEKIYALADDGDTLAPQYQKVASRLRAALDKPARTATEKGPTR